MSESVYLRVTLRSVQTSSKADAEQEHRYSQYHWLNYWHYRNYYLLVFSISCQTILSDRNVHVQLLPALVAVISVQQHIAIC